MDHPMSTANLQLVESLVQAIRSLSVEERQHLEKKLFWDGDYPTAQELVQLVQQGESFAFLAEEPDVYTLEDGEAIV
jgi:hypothetical protein